MEIYRILYENRNKVVARQMSKYMKDKFPFLGLKKPERTAITKEFLKNKGKDREVDWDFIFKSFQLPEREFHYLAIEYMDKIKEIFTPDDMINIEKLLLTKSWWDSVDAINRIVGHLALKYPIIKEKYISKWLESDNIWLIRISIIFQLKYKDKTDTDFLSMAIMENSNTKEFFIDKGIGWALREYSKTHKDWVSTFISNNGLSKLSVREGSKYI